MKVDEEGGEEKAKEEVVDDDDDDDDEDEDNGARASFKLGTWRMASKMGNGCVTDRSLALCRFGAMVSCLRTHRCSFICRINVRQLLPALRCCVITSRSRPRTRRGWTCGQMLVRFRAQYGHSAMQPLTVADVISSRPTIVSTSKYAKISPKTSIGTKWTGNRSRCAATSDTPAAASPWLPDAPNTFSSPPGLLESLSSDRSNDDKSVVIVSRRLSAWAC